MNKKEVTTAVSLWYVVVLISMLISLQMVSALEVSLSIPDKYQKVQAGERLFFEIQLKNIESAGRHDISLDYIIKKNDVVITSRRELKAVETQASFLASIKVPEETISGMYDIEVKVNDESVSQSSFFVKSSDLTQVKIYLLLLTFAIIIIGFLIFWELHKLNKRKR
ncbi:hypothetical protein HNV12_02065 [Methanococcoides sp. SA1]|nr:hypothetical protein [Methanococcoides sp. SA1]